MSREAYNSLPNIGTRGSPGNRARRLTELPTLPTVDRSPSRDFQKGSPLGKEIHYKPKKNFFPSSFLFYKNIKHTFMHQTSKISSFAA